MNIVAKEFIRVHMNLKIILEKRKLGIYYVSRIITTCHAKYKGKHVLALGLTIFSVISKPQKVWILYDPKLK